jgi:hypothetical protein
MNSVRCSAGISNAAVPHPGSRLNIDPLWFNPPLQEVSVEFENLLVSPVVRRKSMIPPRSRVRFFAKRAVIAVTAFVDDFCEKWRTRLGPNRKSGARMLRGNARDVGSLPSSAWDSRMDVE